MGYYIDVMEAKMSFKFITNQQLIKFLGNLGMMFQRVMRTFRQGYFRKESEQSLNLGFGW